MTSKQWQESVKLYEKLIFTICFQMVRDYQQAQDLTQETFLSAFTHRQSCNVDTVKPWLSKIAANKSKDYLKSAYNRRVKTEMEDVGESQAPDFFLPEQLVMKKEQLEKIIGYIMSLDEPYALVSKLYFVEQKSVAEITKILSRPQKTIQTQLYRARNILRQKIKEGGLHEDF